MCEPREHPCSQTIANGVPLMDVDCPANRNRLEVTPFAFYGWNTQADLDEAIETGLILRDKLPVCRIVDTTKLETDKRIVDVLARYSVDRIIAMKGGKHTGSPRPQDRDLPSIHPPTAKHAAKKAEYIAKVREVDGIGTKPHGLPVGYNAHMASIAVRAVAERYCKPCVPPPGSVVSHTDGAESKALNDFQLAEKGKPRCFCGHKNAHESCHLTVGEFVDGPLRRMAPVAYKFLQTHPGRHEMLQAALDLDTKVNIDRKFCMGSGGKLRGVIFAHTLGDVGSDDVPVENADGTIA